jgi:putative ABC transport system permease protein
MALHELRIPFRHLRKSPGFTTAAVLMLALGIGATTAIFSIVEGVLLQPLPFPHPERLVELSDVLQGGNDEAGVTAPRYSRLRARHPQLRRAWWVSTGRL